MIILLAFIVLFFYLSAQNTIVALIRDESRKIKVIWKMKIIKQCGYEINRRNIEFRRFMRCFTLFLPSRSIYIRLRGKEKGILHHSHGLLIYTVITAQEQQRANTCKTKK